MIEKGKGGANTKTGLVFEGNVDFLTFIRKQKDYTVSSDNVIFYKGKKVCVTFKKMAYINI